MQSAHIAQQVLLQLEVTIRVHLVHQVHTLLQDQQLVFRVHQVHLQLLKPPYAPPVRQANMFQEAPAILVQQVRTNQEEIVTLVVMALIQVQVQHHVLDVAEANTLL